ncbi:hypothetical protein Droror1_Dr00008800 [Drosera rotundifolia]
MYTFKEWQIPLPLGSGAECSIHADIHRWSLVPVDLREEMGQPWCSIGGLRFQGLLHFEVQEQAILDHQELMGDEMGRSGYYRLCRGHGVCGVNTMVSAVVTQVS